MRAITLLLVCLLLSFDLIAQDPAHPAKLTESQFMLMDQARKFLASGQDVVFSLPCDKVSGWDANLKPGQSAVFSEDRFKNKDHAISFSFGGKGLEAKPGNYFDGDFTISVWVYVESISKWSRIIDFGIGQNNSNIVFSNSASMSGIPGLAIYRGAGSDLTQIRGTEKDRLKEGQWYHLAATLSGTTARLYINGIEVQKAENFYKPGNISRPNCLIGKSNFEGESNFYGQIDDLKIFKSALSDIHIKLLANWSFEMEKKVGTPDTSNVNQPGATGPGSVGTLKKEPVPSDPGTQASSTAGTASGQGKNPKNETDPPAKPGTPATPSNGITTNPENKTTENDDSTSIPNKIIPLKCSKSLYKKLDLSDVIQKPGGLATANEILAREGNDCWQLKGDLGSMWLFKVENATDKWEHKIVLADKNTDPIREGNTLGQEGWEMTHYFVLGAVFSRPLNPAERKKWECTVLVTPNYATNEKDLAANRDSAEQMLNQMGADGWDILAIIKNKHILKKTSGTEDHWSYWITAAQSPDGMASSSNILGLQGWRFGAIPIQQNSVNFVTPAVYKRIESSMINQRVYCSYRIERAGLLGGGNKNLYDDIEKAVNEYTRQGWAYESPVDSKGDKFALLFSASRFCLKDNEGFMLGIYDCPESTQANYISMQFLLYTAKIPGILQYSRSSRILNIVRTEHELSASGLVSEETKVNPGLNKEEISARFTDAGNNHVKATIEGKKGSKSFDFDLNHLTVDVMYPIFQQMVDYAAMVK